jgi:hypothetical protein
VRDIAGRVVTLERGLKASAGDWAFDTGPVRMDASNTVEASSSSFDRV